MLKELEVGLQELYKMPFHKADDLLPKNGIEIPLIGLKFLPPYQYSFAKLPYGIGEEKRVPVEAIVSSLVCANWVESFVDLPHPYIRHALTNGYLFNGVQLVDYKGLYLTVSMGWKVAVAKLKGITHVEALVLEGVEL